MCVSALQSFPYIVMIIVHRNLMLKCFIIDRWVIPVCFQYVSCSHPYPDSTGPLLGFRVNYNQVSRHCKVHVSTFCLEPNTWCLILQREWCCTSVINWLKGQSPAQNRWLIEYIFGETQFLACTLFWNQSSNVTSDTLSSSTWLWNKHSFPRLSVSSEPQWPDFDPDNHVLTAETTNRIN